MAWQAIAAQLAVRGGLWLLNKYVLNDEKKAPKPRPEAIEFPLTEIGTPIPVVYGTVRLDSLVLVWIGNESYYLSTSTNKNIYRADMLFVIGVPPSDVAGTVQVPDVLRFFYADTETDGSAFGGGLLHEQARVVNPGSSVDEDFKAVIEFFDGRDDQDITNYPTTTADFEIDHHMRILSGVDGGTIPGYRHQMILAVLATPGRIITGRLGESPQVKSLGVEVRARGFDPPSGDIYDANPAWVIYDLICGPVFKLGYPTSKVDLASFEACAATLETEVHGCSVAIQSLAQLRDVLAGLLDQIDGVLYEDHTDGKIKLRLIRAGDTSVKTLDSSNMLREQYAPRIQLVNWSGVANEVVVSFTNRTLDYKQDVATADRVANYLGQSGRPRPRRVDFPFCTNSTLANKLAARELAIAARPLITMTAYVNRSMFSLLPGDVVTVDRPDLNLDEVDFRVMDVDIGQLADNRIMLTLVENVFDNSLGNNPVPVDPSFPYLLPIHERLLTEAPPWMQQKLYDAGILTATSSEPIAYIFAAAANTDDSVATDFKTLGTNLFDPSLVNAEDKPLSGEWLKHATVKTAYPRTADPYDTTLGLELESVTTQLDAVFTALGAGELADSDIAGYGASLSVLYDPDTDDHEFIAWQSSEAITGGRKLTKVWRGLLDTVPRDWPVGTLFVHLHAQYGNSVGRVPRLIGQEVEEQFIPRGSVLTGSGDDPIDAVTIVGRSAMPAPVADFGVNGRDLIGTEGDPQAFAGHYKAVSHFEAAGDIYANKRDRTASAIIRGDETGQIPEATEVYDVVAQLADESESEVELLAGESAPSTLNQHAVLLGAVGHGEIDVRVRSRNTDTEFSSFLSPAVRVTAPTWRNLLANPHAIGNTNTVASTAKWTNITGTVQATQGTSSPSQSATGAYFTSATASGSETVFQQTVDVRGYKPVGLTALLDFYYRNFSDADDTIEVELEALAANGSTVLDSATSGALVGNESLWTRTVVDLLIPASTVYLRVTVTLTGVSESTPSTAFAEPVLTLGQVTDQLLDNPSFDAEPTGLAMTLTALDSGDSTLVGGILNPEHGESIGYTIDIEATGSHTDVEIVFTIPKRASTTSGYVLDDISVASLETLIAAANTDWTVDADDSAGAGPLVLTFTQATLSAGSHQIDLSVGGLGDSWMNMQMGTSSVFGSTVYRTSTSNLILVGSSNETAVADGGVNSSIDVGDVFCEVLWVTDPTTEDEETTVEMYSILHSNSAGGTMTMVVQISDAVTCSEPTVDANTGGWSVGSWSSPGGGVQWQATLTKTSPSNETAYNIRFATTPSTTGTIAIDLAVSWVGYGYTASDSDTATVESAATWTVDATSGIACPADATEWAAFISANGLSISVPDHLWLCQEASGNLADSIGSATLNASGSPLYNQSVSGWSRLAVASDPASADYFLTTAVQNTTTGSFTVISLSVITAPSGASRYLHTVGTARWSFMLFNTTPRMLVQSSPNSTTGGSNPTAAVRPFGLKTDRTNTAVVGFSDQEKLSPTWNNPNGATYQLGAGGTFAVGHSTVYAFAWDGANAEISDANIKALLQAMGFTIPWS